MLKTNSYAGQAVTVNDKRNVPGSLFHKIFMFVPYIGTALDMARFVLELPFRWKSMELWPALPLHTKIGYGLMLNAVTDMWLCASGIKKRDLDPDGMRVVKNYIGIMNTIDDFIDDDQDNRRTPSFCKDDEIRVRRKQLFASFRQFDEPVQNKLKRVFSESTYTMMSTTAMFKDRGVHGLEDALTLRMNTSGELAKMAARIFNITHNVPQEKGELIESVYAGIGMAMQVFDDLGDVCIDEKNGNNENLVLQVLNLHPEEKSRLMEALSGNKRCTYGMLKRFAPKTAMAVVELQERFLTVIPETHGFDRIKRLITITSSLRGQFIVFRLIIDRMEL